MAVMESVAVRQRGGFDFATHYDGLCALNNSYPIQSIKSHLQQRILDMNADRIRASDWMPVLNTLKINRTLEYIAIRSVYQHDDDKDGTGLNSKKRMPAIHSKEITCRLARSLRECLNVNFNLKCIELLGVPLRERDATTLAKGLAKSHSLSHLSFEYSILGDDVVEILCGAIKNTICITSINLSSCGLTWKSAEILAEVIKHQAMLRHNEAWQDSLRYRKPDLDRMSGIRRITANCNPMISDVGAQILADVLKDDLWLKAIDLQQCGITDIGGKALLEILKFNTTIVVMDIRQNPLIAEETMNNIMDQVVINSGGQETQYQWIKARPVHELPLTAAQQQRGAKLRRKKTRSGQSNFYGARKSAMRGGASGSARKRSRPVTTGSSGSRETIPLGHGMPWRTALRAQHYKGHQSDHEQGWTSAGESHSDVSTSVSSPHLTKHPSFSSPDQRRPIVFPTNLVAPSAASNGDTRYRSLVVEDNRMTRVPERLFYRHGTSGEVETGRTESNERIYELAAENERLRKELQELQAKRSVLDDDNVLESIEQSFQQFHAFLDLLRDAGLGQLIEMAGLNKSEMPFANSRTGSPAQLPNARSRHDTTMQMRSFVEQSRLDGTLGYNDQSFASDRDTRRRPADGGVANKENIRASGGGSLKYTNNNATVAAWAADTSALTHSHDDGYNDSSRNMTKSPSSRYDELYERVMRDTENVLRGGGIPGEKDRLTRASSGHTHDGRIIQTSQPDKSQNSSGRGTEPNASKHNNTRTNQRATATQNDENSDGSRGGRHSADHKDRGSASDRSDSHRSNDSKSNAGASASGPSRSDQASHDIKSNNEASRGSNGVNMGTRQAKGLVAQRSGDSSGSLVLRSDIAAGTKSALQDDRQAHSVSELMKGGHSTGALDTDEENNFEVDELVGDSEGDDSIEELVLRSNSERAGGDGGV